MACHQFHIANDLLLKLQYVNEKILQINLQFLAVALVPACQVDRLLLHFIV